MAAGSLTINLQNMLRTLDTADSKGPTSRNLQSGYAITLAAKTLLFDIAADGVAANYTLSEEWTEANRAAYKTAVDAALVAMNTALVQWKLLTKL